MQKVLLEIKKIKYPNIKKTMKTFIRVLYFSAIFIGLVELCKIVISLIAKGVY